jgi:competence protein ComEA
MDGPFTWQGKQPDMVRSLLIKLAMLAVTLGSLVWIGSVTPIRQVTPQHIQPAAAAPIAVAPRPSANDSLPVHPSREASDMIPDVSNRPQLTPVETPEPPALSRGAHVASPDPSRRIDLNHATAADLEALPGIGPKLAQRVIEHRRSHGPFTKAEDLRLVKGIGHKKFDRLRPHVLVTNSRSPSRHKGTP